ncbi:polyprenol phosphomannose-dependent alpha 1,6 mannosyltransferase MptB [Nocardioides pacificus]
MLTRGVIGSVLVLLGGLVVSTLPESTPLLELDALVATRGAMAGRMAGLAVVLVGLGMLGSAWLSLCRYAAHAGGAAREEALGVVRLAATVWSLPLLVAPPLFSRDGWSYAAQGTMTALGISPYEHGPGVMDGPIVEAVDPRWMETPVPYGPVPLGLGAAAAHVIQDPWLLVVAHRGVALLGLVLLAWAVPRLARWTGANPALATAIAVTSPLMMANGVAGLHNDLLMVGVMAAALVVGVENGWAWGAVLGGVAAAVKLPGGLVCIAVALVSLPVGAGLVDRLRRLVSVGAVSVGTLVAAGLPWQLGIGWVNALGVPGTVNTPLSVPTVLGGLIDLFAEAVGAGLAPATFLEVTRTLASVASLLVAGWVALRWRTGSPAQGVAAMAVVLGAALLLCPVVHLWYFLWLVPFVPTLRLSRAGTTAVVAVALLTGLAAPLDSSLHGAYVAIVFGAMTVGALFAALLLTHPARARLRRIADADWLAVRG